jgi:cell volume regulation protein A
MNEIADFGLVLLVVSAGLAAALLVSKVSERVPVPAPVLFLVAAAFASELFPALEGHHVAILTVERIAVVALIIILFDGGMSVGWSRFRSAALPITALGLLGTGATAALVAVIAHGLLGFGWTTAWILGAALAPTDPAVMFSVLGNREIRGRSGTILEGESGVNDPVAIALVIGIVEYATHGDATAWTIAGEVAVELGVGLAVGLAGGLALIPLMQRLSLPREGFYPIMVLAVAGVVYGLASVLHGSGFLAVFLAGLVIGDIRAPFKHEVERFHASLAGLAEIAVFVALGVTVDLEEVFADGRWLDGILLAAVVALVARPAVVLTLLAPAHVRTAERLFIAWSGFKGAVPILLAAFAFLAGAEGAGRIYDIVFVVVAVSVLVQGSTIAFAARRLGVRMRSVEPGPWELSVRLRREPAHQARYVVGSGARAVGSRIRDLPLGDGVWISLVVREGDARQPRGSFVVQPGDEIYVLGRAERTSTLRRLFEGR